MKAKIKTISANNAEDFDRMLNMLEGDIQDIRIFVSHIDAGCTIQAFYTAVIIYKEAEK